MNCGGIVITNFYILLIFQKVEYRSGGTAFDDRPGNLEVRESTKRYKKELIQMTAYRSRQPALSNELFLLHEGASAALPVVGMQAIQSAEAAALKLIDGGGDE